jgi:imidazolonepropionase
MLPAVAKRELAKFVDVFCDRGAFSEMECSTIFGAALEHGFAVRAHLGQLSSPKEGFIEATLECCRPSSFDHMDHVRDREVAALATSDTVVTFVPNKLFSRIGEISTGAKIHRLGRRSGIGNRFNPGTSPTVSMPMAMSWHAPT